MAHSLSAKKRVRQNVKRKALNRWRLKSMRDAIKDFSDRILHGTQEEAKSAFSKACQIIDKSAQKGVIHRNQASRRKSRLSARLKAGVKAGAKAAKA